MIFKTKAKLFHALLIVGLAITSVAAGPRIVKDEENNNLKDDMVGVHRDESVVVRLGMRPKPIAEIKDTEDLDEEDDNKLISYEPMLNKIKYPEIEAYLNDFVKSRNLDNVESSQIVPQKESPKLVVMDQKKPADAIPTLPVMEQAKESSEISPAREVDIKLIAHNSREVRLIGPEEKEVEMKDDAATKMAVALENLKKEAGEVWGQVNTKLDKGWTDFKAMVEDAVESAKKKSSSATSKSSAMDDVAAAADSAVKTIKDQADIAGTKIKGFLNNLGINV